MDYKKYIYNRPKFSPLNYAPHSWWDANDENSVTTYFDIADRISQWNDKSGNGHHLSKNASYDAPYYTNTYQINGRICARFANNWLETAAFGSTISQPYTILIAMEYEVVTPTQQNFFDGISSPNRATIYKAGTSSLFTMFASSNIISSIAAVNGVYTTIVAEFNGASSELDVNGTTNTGNPGANSLAGAGLGQRYDHLFPAYVKIGEILIFDRLLTSGEKTQLKTYLSNKWAA